MSNLFKALLAILLIAATSVATLMFSDRLRAKFCQATRHQEHQEFHAAASVQRPVMMVASNHHHSKKHRRHKKHAHRIAKHHRKHRHHVAENVMTFGDNE